MTLEERRLWEWISYLEDAAIADFDDTKVGMFRKIREGKTLKDYFKELGKEDLYKAYRGGR